MRGLIHIGLNNYPGGRAGDQPSIGLSDHLKEIGFNIGRLKTGTPARLDSRSIDFSKLEVQLGDDPPKPFSFTTTKITTSQIPCHIAYTNQRSHDIIRSGLDRSPLYSGVIEGIGPRYCPSIEDKVVRFPDKDRHQTFIEPEGLDTIEVYPSGMSTSLPIDIQIAFYRSMTGLERVEIMRPAYAIEYDYVDPIQLHNSLETKVLKNLYHAGQINGTSGYEEAAAQGLMAGVNAALRVKGEEPVVLGRSQAYIGVMIDDLVTLGTKEPYRMFTSRAEYRLLLREDNADLRLREIGYRLGLVPESVFAEFIEKCCSIDRELSRIQSTRLKHNAEELDVLARLGLNDVQKGTTLEHLLKRSDIGYEELMEIDTVSCETAPEIREQVEIQTKYKGYIDRQLEQVEQAKKFENTRIPEEMEYSSVKSLTTEVREKLTKYRPDTLGQASRIPGVTPAAISILSIAIKSSSWKGDANR
jgi:tRNA uridine 5-carboxymethylaminomethyl modification enzyme